MTDHHFSLMNDQQLNENCFVKIYKNYDDLHKQDKKYFISYRHKLHLFITDQIFDKFAEFFAQI